MASLNEPQETTGNQNQQKVKLVEMGPRMKLKFISYKESSGRHEEDGEEVQQLKHPEMGGEDEAENGEEDVPEE